LRICQSEARPPASGRTNKVSDLVATAASPFAEPDGGFGL
jgi:hypothetical protein